MEILNAQAIIGYYVSCLKMIYDAQTTMTNLIQKINDANARR